MNDAEINRALAEIEGLDRNSDFDGGVWVNGAGSGRCTASYSDGRHQYLFDPLHDDAQAFRLMVKHLLDVGDLRRDICLAVLAKHKGLDTGI